MRWIGAILFAVSACAAHAEEVTSTAILDNLMGAVQDGGYGCSRVVTAQRLSDDEMARTQFLVVCANGASDFYRVAFPPNGPAVVKPDRWRR